MITSFAKKLSKTSSIAIVGAAIAIQAGKGTLLSRRSADCLMRQLSEGTHPMRAQVRGRLAGLVHGHQREALAKSIAELLTRPQKTEIAIELLELLALLSPTTNRSNAWQRRFGYAPRSHRSTQAWPVGLTQGSRLPLPRSSPRLRAATCQRGWLVR